MRRIWPAIAIIILLAVLFRLLVYLADATPATGTSKQFLISSIINWSDSSPRGILQAGIPMMAWAGEAESLPRMVSPGETVKPLIGLFTLDRQQPLHMLQSQMPFLEADFVSDQESVAVTAQEPTLMPLADDEAEEKTTTTVLSEDNLVGVYFTHTGETYALTDGMERLHGKKGGVVKVGEALQQELEENHGIRVACSDTINDTIYADSYVRSQETLTGLLENNTSLQVVLDIHRDAGKSRENSLVTVHGQEVAPVLIVVGSDARASFPAWRENYDFARELAAEMEKQHPGLCLGVQIKEGRYNQFLHPGAILLEVGSVSNSTEEAVRTGRLLAGPVAELVKRSLDANTETSASQ
ncbi:MAG: hypothetical protein JL56_09790 [Desulfotomaculum sp. BICA1-6]|nr:MAG: hypothetical protein VR67_14195 [Peptococcaceae bacterium BRH_c8a]KJS74136.1 MAG: hypothetical protein JL56_09790 [Desulfotomaculum sp. BICA1-6]